MGESDDDDSTDFGPRPKNCKQSPPMSPQHHNSVDSTPDPASTPNPSSQKNNLRNFLAAGKNQGRTNLTTNTTNSMPLGILRQDSISTPVPSGFNATPQPWVSYASTPQPAGLASTPQPPGFAS